MTAPASQPLPSRTWAIASLSLGIIGLLTACFFVPSALAILFGAIALRSKDPSSGKALAASGLILGAIGLLLGIFLWSHFYA